VGIKLKRHKVKCIKTGWLDYGHVVSGANAIATYV
jgi:hypothetical protein